MEAATYRPGSAELPEIAREYRAAWVATVANIDWPSKMGLTTSEQKAELIQILDKAADLRLNVVIFQVRPACDALYASKIEPWSEYLTGTAGKAPLPFYDPLAFAVEEAHKRGLELHAWFNPYRARHSSAKSPVSAGHVSKLRPQLVREYGSQLWLDPGEKAVQDYSLSVVMDVVNRYDVDGIHFDDYFYPYKERAPGGGELDFPDEASWKRFGAASGMNREDWRRENVNQFIERVYRAIKDAKPWVKFGLSPFGIWRPGYPSQIRGLDAYSQLYADSRKWITKGWCDYFAPQLYWAIDPPQQSYPALLKWWTEQNPTRRHVVPGLDATKVPRRWKPDEVLSQIQLTRQQPGSAGHVHWNMRSLMRNPELSSRLKRQVYSQPALTPPLDWVRQGRPAKPRPTATVAHGRVSLSWQGGEAGTVHWVVQTREGKLWRTRMIPGVKRSCDFEGAPEIIGLTAIDRFGNSSAAAILQLKR